MVTSLDVVFEDVQVLLGGRSILEGLSGLVPGGSSTALVGVSGCGKTTMLRTLAGLNELARGRVLIAGKPPGEHYRTQCISVLFQEANLWKHLTVERTLELTFRLHRKHPDDARIKDILQKVGLWQAKDLYPHQLSVGMKARLAISRSFCIPPGLLLADEPFAALDPIRRLQLNRDLQQMQAENGSTAIWVTHDVVEAMQFANQIIVLGHRPARIARVIDMSQFPTIDDDAKLPSECLQLRDELLTFLVEDGALR